MVENSIPFLIKYYKICSLIILQVLLNKMGGNYEKCFLIFLAGIFLVSCASAPGDLGSQYVPASTYSNLTCDKISASLRTKNNRLSNLYATLDKKRSTDNIQTGLGLLIFWPALFFLEGGDGPDAAEYRKLKGEVEALGEASINKGC